MLTSTSVTAVEDDAICVRGPKGVATIPVDSVVVAVGLTAQHDLYDELVEAGTEAYLVGDAIAPGKIFDAFHTAYRTALKL